MARENSRFVTAVIVLPINSNCSPFVYVVRFPAVIISVLILFQ